MTGRIRMHNETAGEIAIQSQIERDNGFLGLDCRHGRVAPHSRRPECGDYQNNLATHRIEPDPERAPIIVKLFEWYASVAIGFTLHDLAAALSERDRGGAPCRNVRALVAERLAELESRLSDFAELRDELQLLLRDWDLRLAQIPGGTQARLLDVLAGRPVIDRAVIRQQRTIRNANRRRLERRQ